MSERLMVDEEVMQSQANEIARLRAHAARLEGEVAASAESYRKKCEEAQKWGQRYEGERLLRLASDDRAIAAESRAARLEERLGSEYARGYREGVEAAAKALETHGRNDAGTKITLACIRALSPPYPTSAAKETP